jgi:hypothetical protein
MKEQILVKCHCFKCGVVGESILNNAGPHIKQSCLNCGAYKKFIPKKEIPPKEVIKQAIWIKVKNLNKIIK